MNETVNNFLLAGDKFMLKMHLRRPRFTCSVCGPFTKNKGKLQKFKGTWDSWYIYQNELDKACFEADFQDLRRRTAADKTLRFKAFIIAKNPKYVGYQREPASMVYKFFDK